jgi:CDP-diacylglycerol--glycerol-3-phosphate 3-phosphatidyltransferase
MLLFIFRGDFVIEPSGLKLDRVNKANAITLFRLSTLPTILFIILASKDYPMRYQLVALVAIVFATDFLDGYISRRYKETTRVGRMMDSASDYSLLFVISIVFHYFKIIPAWFLVLLISRLAGQAVMLLAVLAVKKRITPKTSFLGKATVASTMVLYAFELLRFVADIPTAAFQIIEAIVGVIIVVSIIDKILMMVSDLGSSDRASSKTGRLNPIVNGDTDGSDKKRA